MNPYSQVTPQAAPELDPLALRADDLRWRCAPIEPSKESAATHLLTQPRPLEALRTGLELRAEGFHVVVGGPFGSGRVALVERLIDELHVDRPAGPDRVYLLNFNEPFAPRLLTLPCGRGPEFQREMEDLLRRTQDALQAALASRPHKMSRRLVLQTAQERQRRLMDAMARLAERDDCVLVQYETQSGAMAADICPVHEGETLSREAIGALVADGQLSHAERDELLARRDALTERLEEVYDRSRRISRHIELELRGMNRQVASRILETHFREFQRHWDHAEVATYLGELRLWVERHLDQWIADEVGEPGGVPDGEPGAAQSQGDLSVHVIKTVPAGARCPVVIEVNPTYNNLFGTIDTRDAGALSISSIHGGAILRADGGFLILRAADVLSEPGVWAQLKRTLKTGRLEIREFDASSGVTTGPLLPEPIAVDVKVVLIAEPGMFEHLAAEDQHFLQTFKIYAEFDTSIPADAENLQRYADALVALAEREGLANFSPDAVAALAEFGARCAGRRDRVTTCFADIADVGREASLYARRAKAETIERGHVAGARRLRQQRLDLTREHVERDQRDGYVLLRTEGRAVGQLNSLTVLDIGTFAFGRPVRITAATGAAPRGRARVVNIEREAELSGPLHDKGVMILWGYLLDRFGQDGELGLHATLCFEQNYGGVDGDSASGAELFALLSSLSKVPLDQGIGVTGSVNQKGEIQAVSGVNEKIEGFFRLCMSQGLTGNQGVVLPRSNAMDLMLDDEIVEAVRDGSFHVWAIDGVDEGLAILTGRKPEEIMDRAAETLRRFREATLG